MNTSIRVVVTGMGADELRGVLAHELSHVVQQSQGPVDGSDAPGGIRVSSPSDRFERSAEETADDPGAHAAEPDHSELHDSFLWFRRLSSRDNAVSAHWWNCRAAAPPRRPPARE